MCNLDKYWREVEDTDGGSKDMPDIVAKANSTK